MKGLDRAISTLPRENATRAVVGTVKRTRRRNPETGTSARRSRTMELRPSTPGQDVPFMTPVLGRPRVRPSIAAWHRAPTASLGTALGTARSSALGPRHVLAGRACTADGSRSAYGRRSDATAAPHDRPSPATVTRARRPHRSRPRSCAARRGIVNSVSAPSSSSSTTTSRCDGAPCSTATTSTGI